MAGTITVTQSSNFRGTAREKFRTLTMTSDAADGSLPDQDLYSLGDCVMTGFMYDPDDVDTPTGTFEVLFVEKADTDRIVYETGSIDATAFLRDITTGYTGNWAKVDGPITLKFVDPANHANACDIGNSNVGVLKFRFEKK